MRLKDLSGKSRLRKQVSAYGPSYFLLHRQKKVSKEKASQRPCPYGVPCATRAARGRAQTRYAQTSARPDPAAAALLSTANGPGIPNTASAPSLRAPCTPVLGLDCHLGCACRGPYFLLLRQKKVSKEKASQRPCPCGVPCATRAARGRAQTRYAQTSARPDPASAALLSTAYGPGSPNTPSARSLR